MKKVIELDNLDLEVKIVELELVIESIGKALHYPKCWDTMAYPTIIHAIKEVNRCTQCQDVKLEKSHIDYLNDIYGAVNGRELHSQAVKPFVPGALRLCQNVFAEINKPEVDFNKPF